MTYDMRLVVRDEKIYLQIMWAYLEQKSFPMNETSYRLQLQEILSVVNDLGKADIVRKWLLNTNQKPKLGRAVTFYLKSEERSKEFLI